MVFKTAEEKTFGFQFHKYGLESHHCPNKWKSEQMGKKKKSTLPESILGRKESKLLLPKLERQVNLGSLFIEAETHKGELQVVGWGWCLNCTSPISGS